MMNLRDYKGKDVSAAQLHVECTTTADVFDVEGNVLATIHWQGDIPMDDVAYIRLNGDGYCTSWRLPGGANITGKRRWQSDNGRFMHQ